MKKIFLLILTTVLLLSLVGCGRNQQTSFEFSITVPAGSTAEFVYSDTQISPLGKEITVSSGQGLGDTEVVLLPVEGHAEAAYSPAYLTPGKPVTMEAEKDVWFQVGVSVQNPTDENLRVTVIADGVVLRVP